MVLSKSQTNILLVEGTDDLHTIANLVKYHLKIKHVETLIDIKAVGGINKLFNKLKKELLLETEMENLGIVVDADYDIDARWQSIKNNMDKLKNIKIKDMPEKPEKNGAIFSLLKTKEQKTIKVGIWLMPNNQDTGMLEDFLLGLMPLSNDNILKHIECCLDELSDSDLKILKIDSKDNPETWRLKAKLHTWLAWQKEPGDPYGTAIGKYFKPSLEITQNFMAWLSDLFELDTRL